MKPLKLQRYLKNPLLSPTKNSWENLLVFNPAAIKVRNKIHLLYRAQGTDDPVSRLGHAVSSDGIHFTRSSVPLYYGHPNHFSESLGIEDPRTVLVDETVYIVYTAVSENKGAPINPKWREPISKTAKIGLSTTKNFVDFNDYDLILPDFQAKNASLFPKKNGDEFWLLYRRDLTTYFSKSHHLKDWKDGSPVFTHRPHHWDQIRTGIGTPPIESELGWLLIYHGVDIENVYRLGLIVLDKDDPTQIIYRSKEPILEPLEPYEKVGFFPNVVFSCGAVEIDNQYYVYYGGADNVIGLATISKDELLEEVKSNLGMV